MSTEARATATDPFLLEIVRNHLVTTCREMGIAMMRTSYSPIFNEGLDFSCLIFDRDVEMVAQAEFVPAMVGSGIHAVATAINEIGRDRLAPGDVFVMNDPYRSNNHIPEHILFKPYFEDGEILGYSASIAHMVDVGGMVPAAFGNMANVFQEGLRLPPIKIYSEDRELEDVFRVILSNTRTPKYSYGDFEALIGSLYLAEREMRTLVERYGADTFVQACTDIKNVSETLMREQIRSWPDGVYEEETFIEDDGIVPDRPARIATKVVIRDDRLIMDFTGSDGPVEGSMNMTFGATVSAAYIALSLMVDKDIPLNAGSYRCVAVILPPGTLVNASYPRATVGGNSEGQPTVADMVLRAFAQFSDRSAAGRRQHVRRARIGGVDPRTGDPFAYLHLEGVGWGGSAQADGNDCQFTKIGNCANTPVEVMESRFPMVNVEYELERFAGGAGEHRGGFGSRRFIRVLADGLQVSSMMNRHVLGAPGLRGGDPAATNTVRFRTAGETESQDARTRFGTASNGKYSNMPLGFGDEIMIVTAGGAGCGPPLARDPEAVLADYRDELIDARRAREAFGVVIDERTSTVDAAATASARRERGEVRA